MRAFRRRLASVALALTALQLAVLFAMPVSACCTRVTAAPAQASATVDKGDCCPAGSHAPGQCPLHKAQTKSTAQETSPAGDCRMLCDAHGPQFVLGAIGVLPAPPVSDLTFAASALRPRAVAIATSFAPFPDGPPPKLL